jgi:hypothetical protein
MSTFRSSTKHIRYWGRVALRTVIIILVLIYGVDSCKKAARYEYIDKPQIIKEKIDVKTTDID